MFLKVVMRGLNVSSAGIAITASNAIRSAYSLY
jgi:hypothetical protein